MRISYRLNFRSMTGSAGVSISSSNAAALESIPKLQLLSWHEQRCSVPTSIPLQEAFALARSRASRRRSRRSRRGLARSAGCGSGGSGAISNTGRDVSSTGDARLGSLGAGRASMNSNMSRPLEVSLQPPLMRSTKPCEKMSRSGTRLARRLVRSAQSRPLVARMAMSRLRSSMMAKPSG